MKTNTKLSLLTALTLAVLPTVALANPTVGHVATFAPPAHFTTANPPRPHVIAVPFQNALQFNEIDGQPQR